MKKKRCNLVHSERSEIINLKSTTLGIINQQQQKLFGIFLSSINPDVHVNKQKHFIKGGGMSQKQRYPIGHIHVFYYI